MQTDLFHTRRAKLLDTMRPNSLALIASGSEQIRNRDVEHGFRADSDFWYLTGFTEPDAVLVLIGAEVLAQQAKQFAEASEDNNQQDRNQKDQNQQVNSAIVLSPPFNNQAWLFLRPKDVEKETWQGRRLGVDAAPASLAVDLAFDIDELDEQLLGLLGHADAVYFSFDQLADWGLRLADWVAQLKPKARKGINTPNQLLDLDGLLHEQRLIKSPIEIEWMKQAAQISVQGHLAAMRSAQAGGYEYQIHAAVEQAFRYHGSPRVAFNTIVASGDNACILHYTENNAPLKNGDLVLIDAGAEFNGYAGDISHTFPVNGRFSAEQKQLYSLVLAAQQAAIAQIKPGNRYDEMHRASMTVLTQGLLGLGLMRGELEPLLQNHAIKKFFMHGTGHWLGMDVHDVGRYKINGEWRLFQPGMVVTVEPGLYIAPDDQSVEAKWRGIGVRIEDDVWVTEQGSEVLTQGLPRTPEEIEQWMQQTQMC